MTPTGFAHFYADAGYKVLHSPSGTWFNASEHIFRSLPLSRPIAPGKEELQQLLREHRLVGVEYANQQRLGLPCCAFKVRNKQYGENCLQRTFLQHLRKGRTACEVREIGFGELERAGMPVNAEVMSRRSYRDPHFVDKSMWQRLCRAGSEHPGAGALGSFAGGELVAYLLYFIEGGEAYGIHLMSRADKRAHRPNHVLYYEFTRRMMERDDVTVVSTGMQSIPPAVEMDRFKRYAGYVAEPCHLAVTLHPVAAAVLLRRATTLFMAACARLRPHDPRISRLRAVIDMAQAGNTSALGGLS